MSSLPTHSTVKKSLGFWGFRSGLLLNILFSLSIIIGLLFSMITLAGATGSETGRTHSRETSNRPEHKEVVVVGGGMAGLTAGFFLKDRDILVLEKTNHYGGIIDTGSFGGFNYPKGPAYIGTPQGPLETLIAEMALKPVEIPEPSQCFFYDGKFYFGNKGVAKLFKEKGGAKDYQRFVEAVGKLANVYQKSHASDLPPELAELDRITAKQWFDKQNLPHIFTEFFDSQARGVFGAGLEKISALSFVPEIGLQFESLEVEKAKQKSADVEEAPEEQKGSGAYTFLNGLSELPEAIVRKLANKTRLGCDVTKISRQDRSFAVHYVDQKGADHLVEADSVIIAIPAPIAREIGKEILNDEQRMLLGNIKYSGYISVSLFCSSPIFDRSFALSVGHGFSFSDLYDASWVQRAYDKDLSKNSERILCAHVPPTFEGYGKIDELPDEALAKRVVSDLEKIFPDAGTKILGHDIRRMRQAFPVMAPGAYQTISRLNEINRGRALLAGDYLIYPSIEAAVESGYLAATKLNQVLGAEKQR
ncbi:MAG: flavin monoamine oxidase family protein [Desulfomonilaceae bacterium]